MTSLKWRILVGWCIYAKEVGLCVICVYRLISTYKITQYQQQKIAAMLLLGNLALSGWGYSYLVHNNIIVDSIDLFGGYDVKRCFKEFDWYNDLRL